MKIKKWHIALIVFAAVIVLTLFFTFVIIVGFWFLFPTSNRKRQRMADSYVDSRFYSSFVGYISSEDIHYYGDSAIFEFEYTDDILAGLWNGYINEGKRVEVCRANLEILQGSGFFEAIEDGALVTISTDFEVWWDGWDYPVLEVKIGDTVYLDYETGLSNFIDWILYEMY